MMAIGDFLLTRLKKLDASFTVYLEKAFKALESGDTVIHEAYLEDFKDDLIISMAEAKQGKVAALVSNRQQIWLYRLWYQESQVSQLLQERITKKKNHHFQLNDNIYKQLKTEQRNAIEKALNQYLTIISGGPGTGKTFTVSRLVYAQLMHQPQTKIALAAPTGKAAMRMAESLDSAFASLTQMPMLEKAQTLHRLLGISNQGQPKFNADNPLPYDLYIIDEASMLSLELAYYFLNAVKPEASIVLLGDANQLAAVDPGSVLHDIAQHPFLQQNVMQLTASERFSADSGIGQCAQLIQNNQPITNLQSIFESAKDIQWRPEKDRQLYDYLFAPYQNYIATVEAIGSSDLTTVFAHWDNYRILTASRTGRLGSDAINQQLKTKHLQLLNQPTNLEFYAGMPVMILKNDYQNQLFNGDIGVCLENDKHQLVIYFSQRANSVSISQIAHEHISLAYAMTIHKSQGSEFNTVALLIDDQQQRGLSKALIYTGMTRAKKKIQLYAKLSTIERALYDKSKRSTGLAIMLDELNEI